MNEVISVIAGKGPKAYSANMMSAVLRLFALAALLLMPLGTGSMVAAAAPPTAVSGEGHCGDHQKPADAPTKMSLHCASCSALPASSDVADLSDLRPELPRLIVASAVPHENELEIATPPPKLS